MLYLGLKARVLPEHDLLPMAAMEHSLYMGKITLGADATNLDRGFVVPPHCRI